MVAIEVCHRQVGFNCQGQERVTTDRLRSESIKA
jgi:hypothetical protein